MFTTRRALWLALPVSLMLLALAPALPAAAQTAQASAQAPQAADTRYGYFRTIDGAATLVQASEAGDRVRNPASVNQPVMAGDRIEVADRGRVELVLADRNLLRLDGGSAIVLQQLAGSPDGEGRSADGRFTQIRLEEGNFQLVVVGDALGDELPRIDTPNATIYIQYPGAYRITSDQGDWSSVVARSGSVEVVTGRGSVRVRAGEEAHIEGDRDAKAEIAEAGAADAIERWGHDLEEQMADNNGYLDPSLAYEGSSLSQYGTWFEVENHRYWRPAGDTGDSGWRPFTDGYWSYTPSGMTWVATEPWGWVPYHYGSWDFLPGYGWVWEPGTVFASSWVYWYWGPTYVGWCPTGFYTGWYGRHFHDPAFRSGVYGWAGGEWDHFSNWNFVGIGHFGRRDLNRWERTGGDLRGDMKMKELPRGIITTDTRGLTPGRWNHPDQVLQVLRSHGGGGGGRDLPDVTSFVARDPKLPPQVLRTVLADGPQGGGARERLTGTPLRPSTLGTRPTATAQGPGGAAQRGRWAERTPSAAGRGISPGSPGSPSSPASPGSPTAPLHTWDRQPAAPRTVPRPDPGDRAARPPVHTWDRPTTPTSPTSITPRTPASPSRPATPVAPRGDNRPERRQRPDAAPRPSPIAPPPAAQPQPTPRYTPPPPRYTPPPPRPQPAPRSMPPPAPRYTPPPPRPQPAPAPAPRPQPQPPPQKPPEPRHGR